MAGDGEAEQLCSGPESCPRDLLRRFAGISSLVDEQPEAGVGESDEIELSLGLSLHGCFGVDPKRTTLMRSSSIASFMLPREQDFPAAAPLARTCSLPAETAEDQRKRKEMQSLKRLEAKRKRSEKRNSRTVVDPNSKRLSELVEGAKGRSGKFDVELGGISGIPGNTEFGGPVDGAAAWAAGSVRRQADVLGCFPPPNLHGSTGSHGSSSSGVSDFESRVKQGLDVSGFSSSTEGKSPTMMQSLPVHTGHKATASPSTAMVGRTAGCEEHPLRRNTEGEMERKVMEEMPCVSTRGGPNGRRIEGFLYKYRKGEEVRIVCVCHGNFLTPAEFVKHAGGSDVAHPLKHIVVSPSPSAFL